MEVGTSVSITRDPHGTSHLVFAFQGRSGRVTRTAQVGDVTIYYVRMDGEDDVTLPFRENDLVESD